MISKEFDYVAPATLEEALSALRDGGGDAKVLAGGHSLIPMMKLRLAAPSLLVDVRKVGDLHRFDRGGTGTIDIGSMVTHRELSTSNWLAEICPLLGECASTIGDRQVRARGTIGGSLAHGDPAADLPAAMMALNATMVAAKLNGSNGTSNVGTREIPANEFFVDLLTTALEPDEILTTIRVPRLSGRTGSAYVKLRNKASHYALVGAAVALTLDDSGACSDAAVALTGAASTAFRLPTVEDALRGTRLGGDDVSNAVGKVSDVDVEWMSDLFGSEEYRRHVAGVVAARAIETARSRIT